jgi:hypothetical protein
MGTSNVLATGTVSPEMRMNIVTTPTFVAKMVFPPGASVMVVETLVALATVSDTVLPVTVP